MLALQSLNPEGSWHDIFHWKDRMVTPPASALSPMDLVRSGDDHAARVVVRFLTPVLLKQAGSWAKPDFGTLIRRLRNRMNALSYFYCGKPLEMNFREIGEGADEVSTIRESIHWVEEKRYSKHRGHQHVLKGYMGDVEFGGDIASFMPCCGLEKFFTWERPRPLGRDGMRS